jgi:hypothetical protein
LNFFELFFSAAVAAFQNVGIHFDKTRTAKDRTTLRRIKRNGRIFIAAGAIDGDFDALFDSGGLRGGNRSDAFIFGLLAFSTAFRRVSQTFVAEENLLADCPQKLVSAIDTGNVFVKKISIIGKSFLIKLFKVFKICVRHPCSLPLSVKANQYNGSYKVEKPPKNDSLKMLEEHFLGNIYSDNFSAKSVNLQL